MLHPQQGAGEEVFTGGKQEVVPVDSESDGALWVALGSDVEGIAACLAELEFASELDELGLFGCRGCHLSDVEKLEVTDVVPGEDALASWKNERSTVAAVGLLG